YADCDGMRMALQSWLAQNAPTTDGTRMSAFLSELFTEDIGRERIERNELLNRVRTRALTLPPTDELRLIVEHGGRRDDDDLSDEPREAPVRKPGSLGRRASDRNDETIDRRKSGGDRRGPGGRAPERPSDRSFGRSDSTGSVALAAEPQELESEPELIGAEIDGRYRVIELIGEGGMGKVYLAEHIEIGRRVALKVLHPSYSRMPDLVERFRREARAATKIDHPNIVGVTDSGTTADGSVYFVMEFLEGVELGNVIEREGAIDVARALKITGQICRALAAAHREGIIHRDLKPENIFLVTRDGTADTVKVLDFGIAKTTEAEAARERRLTSPGMAMGTPEYMSPEQAAGRPADARCDVYALGAIMYEMVTGIPPYSGDNFMEILTKKATQDPPPPHTVRAELPAPVSDLVTAAMARNPNDRPQTMEALEYELNKCLSGRGVAVAQILGMTTDAHVVAQLNSGLSMRTFDDGPVVARPPTSSPAIGLRAGTHSGMSEMPGMWSGPAMSTGQNAVMGRPLDASPSGSMQLRAQSSPAMAMYTPTPLPSLPPSAALSDPHLMSQPQPMIDVRHSALGVFGWLVVAALLFGGVGALLYIALGERDTVGTPRPAPSPSPSSEVAPPPQTAPVAAPAAPTHTTERADGDAGSAAAAKHAVEPDAVTGSGGASDLNDKKAKRPRVAAATRPSPADEKAIQALVGRAKAFERAGRNADARAVYQKLETTRGYDPGEALYHQAFLAFQANATSAEAANLASQAAELAGPFKTQARILYGDVLYRQQEYKRAKSIYLMLRKQLGSEDQTRLLKKIQACNRQLHLPDNDGLTD
ncbi:MAG TPA: serine/threonine-protein kinase, partial [Kofleriaceae bacterium]